MPRGPSPRPLDDRTAAPCAVCLCAADEGLYRGALWQVKCRDGSHRTRHYQDRRSAIMAWNVNQRHKADQGKAHG